MAAQEDFQCHDRFAATSEELEPMLGDADGAEDWAVDNIAPGQELSDYIPLNTDDSDSTTAPKASVTAADQPIPSGNISTADQPPSNTGNQTPTADQQDPLAELGVCGLINIGNTCYMNASLQCLRSLPGLMQHCLSSGPVPQVEEGDPNKLDKATTCRTHVHATFASLVKKLWCGQFSSVEPQLFKSTVGLLHSQFSGSRQHDSQEFLAALLDSLHEHCSTDDSSVVSDTFQGKLRNEVVCSECGNLSVKVEPFVFLSLPMPGAYDKIVELYYVNSESPPLVTRLAVKVCRYGSVVGDVKGALGNLLGREVPSELLVTAEVLKGTIVRTLADSLPLDRLSSKRGEQLYMFEMSPAQDLLDSIRPSPAARETQSESSTTGLCGDPGTTDAVSMETDEVPMETETTAVVVMEWHSCNICLEEMVDSDLLTHTQCGATLCKDCLSASNAHQEANEQKRKTCPVCSKPLTEESGFKQMTDGSSSDDAISLLLVTVLYRSSDELVGHSMLRHLPTQAQGVVYYRQIAKCLPASLAALPFTLKLTGDKGRSCSRCDFTSKCQGCLLRMDLPGNLKPGDHLTVQFDPPLSTDQNRELGIVSEHPSLSLLHTRQLTLTDCLNAFAQRETLADENSWYCPKCECQRRAECTLSVDNVPHTLIVHLKRFIYHGREGNKVEEPVSFPLELSGVSANDSTKLELTSCICHTGTLHFGHYTAYCKHPCTGEWIHYNDSRSAKVEAPNCQDSVYMLFYQKPSSPPEVDRAKDDFDDSNEQVATETLLRLFKPPAPKLPPSLPLKRSNSNPNLAEVKSGSEDPIHAVKVLRVAACPW